MANLVEFFFNTEAEILALTSADPQWVNLAFYYPTDRVYFYQIIDGVMQRKGASGVGVTLNNIVIGGVKSLIEETDILDIPENYEYNLVNLHIFGVVNCQGNINMLH